MKNSEHESFVVRSSIMIHVHSETRFAKVCVQDQIFLVKKKLEL